MLETHACLKSVPWEPCWHYACLMFDGTSVGLYTFTPASMPPSMTPRSTRWRQCICHTGKSWICLRVAVYCQHSRKRIYMYVHARIWSFEGLKFPFSWKRSCFVRSLLFFDTCVLAALCVSSFILKNSPAVWVVFPYWRCSPCTCGQSQRPSHQLSSIAVLSQWPLLQLLISFVCS